MTGLLLVLLGALSAEAGASIGKREVQKGHESIYLMGFLDAAWGVLLFGVLLLTGSETWRFSAASLPTFGLRAVLEVFQAHMTVMAITKADRSTFGFLRIGTIPLLLMVDVVLGYAVAGTQVIGITMIIGALILLVAERGMTTNGITYVLITAVNAVITLSLMKYNITHFNSVGSEQLLILVILLVYFFTMSSLRSREHPLRLMWQPMLLAQSLAIGIGTVLGSFGFAYLPASIATTVSRSVALLWAVISGNLWFREKSMTLKIIAGAICVAGLVMLMR